ncbi:MAG: hypothetical protein ACON4R_04010 [Akkermansiaceae bacterium]
MKKTTQATFGIIGMALFAGVNTASAEVEAMIGSDISGEISAGWDSQYFFRGLWFGDDTAWTNIAFSKEISSNLTASANVFYTEVLDDSIGGAGFAYSEANVGAALSYDAGYGTWDLAFLNYRFYDGFGGAFDGVQSAGVGGNGDATELSLTYSQDIVGGIALSLTYAYDFRIDGQYGEIGLSKGWSLSDCADLEFSVNVGYSIDDYYSASLGAEDKDFTHALLTLAMPIKVTETATLTPHVSANISGDARDAINAGAGDGRGDTEVYYGASFSVSF